VCVVNALCALFCISIPMDGPLALGRKILRGITLNNCLSISANEYREALVPYPVIDCNLKSKGLKR
jgi:hypothetical protein